MRTRTTRSTRPLRSWAIVCAVLALWLLSAATALADPRTDFLVQQLRSSPSFRVRTQAAISLGGVNSDPRVISALTGALLNDAHPTVRAASASALERHGDPRALRPLRRAMSDPEPAVQMAASRAVSALSRVARTSPQSQNLPSVSGGRARFYVAVGRPGSRVRGVSRESLDSARSFIATTARSVPGVEIAPDGERAASASQVLRSRNLVGYYLDSSIVALDEQPNGELVARVTIVVQSYPDRNIRAMLNGRARASGSGDSVRRQLIEGALRGAMRGLPQIMATGSRGQ